MGCLGRGDAPSAPSPPPRVLFYFREDTATTNTIALLVCVPVMFFVCVREEAAAVDWRRFLLGVVAAREARFLELELELLELELRAEQAAVLATEAAVAAAEAEAAAAAAQREMFALQRRFAAVWFRWQ